MKKQFSIGLGLGLAAALLVFAAAGFGQDLTITATNLAPSSSGASITGTNTCTNIVAGVTNALTVTVFYGGNDGGEDALAWAHASQNASTFVSEAAYTNTLIGLTPNTVIYYRARAQDLTGEAWSDATLVFTTSVAAAYSPDQVFREALRTGTVARVAATVATIGTLTNTTGVITTLSGTKSTYTAATATTGTNTTLVVTGTASAPKATVTTNTFTYVTTGAVAFAVSADTVTNSSGAEITVLKLTGP